MTSIMLAVKYIVLSPFFVFLASAKVAIPSEDCIVKNNFCQCYNKEESDPTKIVLHCQNLENTSDLGNLTTDLWGDGFVAANVVASKPQTIYSDLRITNSRLPHISHNALNNICYFRLLNLSHNSIRTIEPRTFSCDITERLEELDLSNNNLTEVSGWFVRSPNLKRLHLQKNGIVSVKSNALALLTHLETLNLSFNGLTSIKNDYFLNMNALSVLTLSNNNISVIEDDALLHLSNLRVLDLSFNNLRHFDPGIFESCPKLTNLSLAHNQFVVWEGYDVNTSKNLQAFHIEGNPWACNDSLMWLYNSNQVAPIEFCPNGSRVLCFSPEDLQNKTVQEWVDIRSMERSFQGINTCAICHCYVDRERIIVVVDCQGKGIDHLPQLLPNGTKIVHMENNNIKVLATNTDFLDAWESVQHLYLNNNTIESLKGIEGTRLVQNLALLQLTRNRLRNIPVHILNQFSQTLHDLYLGDNPWDCDCTTVLFQKWLRDHYKQVRDMEKVHCGVDCASNSGKAIFKLMNSDLCPQPGEGVNYLDILNVMMAVLIVTILSKLILDYWWQKRTGKLPHFFSFRLH